MTSRADMLSDVAADHTGPTRVVVFTDYVYHRDGETVYAERAFALFLAALADRVDRVTIVGRLAPDSGVSHYPLPKRIEFVGLPHYASLMRPGSVLASLARSLGRYDRALREADVAWLLGPYPHAIAFALLTRLRGRRLVLGVRQDFPVYIRSRRPDSRWAHRAADAMEWIWRRLARRSRVVVVGPELADYYRGSGRLLETTVSLITDADVRAGQRAAADRDYSGEVTVLSVGRLDSEKNPLLLGDILAELVASEGSAGRRWRMIICGDGPLREPLRQHMLTLGLADRFELRGYVRLDDGLLDSYRSAHVFLHVSLTEGMPQVLTEAFASGVPVVATAVGGVARAAAGAAILIGPGDAGAAARAITRLAGDVDERRRLIDEGLRRSVGQTLDGQIDRIARFISEP